MTASQATAPFTGATVPLDQLHEYDSARLVAQIHTLLDDYDLSPIERQRIFQRVLASLAAHESKAQR